MTLRTWLLSAALACAAAGPALAARQPFDDVFFVKHGGTAEAMFADRSNCRTEALALELGLSAAAYSNPQYGALAAMGAALDSDQLHAGGLKKRMQRAALLSCMRRFGWEQRDLGPGDKEAARASLKKPEALDAWLRANEPAAPPAATAKAETAAEARTEPKRPSYSAEPPAYVKATAATPAETAPAPGAGPITATAAAARP